MRKITILPILMFSVLLTGCQSQQQNNPNAERMQTNITLEENILQENQEGNTVTNTTNTENVTTNRIEIKQNATSTEPPIEGDLAIFTTTILTEDDKRESNINITCSQINNTIVDPGKTFSFTETVGKATTDKGYQEADIFDENGNKTKGLGGGNCQVSSTLYNAVLQTPGLVVTERHPHSEKVYYVPEGKDATVAYGSLDFQFRNDNDYSVKIYASTDTESVTVKIVRLIAKQ